MEISILLLLRPRKDHQSAALYALVCFYIYKNLFLLSLFLYAFILDSALF